jgi:SAM-dependent methyltransferase
VGLPGEHRERHWDSAYEAGGEADISWFQPAPVTSLELIQLLAPALDEAIVDVGGGASTLVDRLAAKGYTDLTVLDISAAALRTVKARAGAPTAVEWLHDDLLRWRPHRVYKLWHDRACFHFFVRPTEREAYLAKLQSALGPRGAVVLGTFAPDGPERCSGLPVARYSANELADLLGPGFSVVERRGDEHRTPGGTVQPFTWIAARRVD